MAMGDPAGTWIETQSTPFWQTDSQGATDCQPPTLAVSEDFEHVVRQLSYWELERLPGWPVFTRAGSDEPVAVNPANVVTVTERYDDWSGLA